MGRGNAEWSSEFCAQADLNLPQPEQSYARRQPRLQPANFRRLVCRVLSKALYAFTTWRRLQLFLNDATRRLGEAPKTYLGVKRRARVLLYPKDVKVESGLQLWVRHVGLLEAKTTGSDEPLVFRCLPREALSHEGHLFRQWIHGVRWKRLLVISR